MRRLFPRRREALDRFEAAGWGFAVCTNKIEYPSVLLLTALGVADRFRAICGKNTFAVSKPDGEALLQTIAAPAATAPRRSWSAIQDRYRHGAQRQGSGRRGRFRLYRQAGRDASSQTGSSAISTNYGTPSKPCAWLEAMEPGGPGFTDLREIKPASDHRRI